jgi:ribose 5-phosphate isomerase B
MKIFIGGDPKGKEQIPQIKQAIVDFCEAVDVNEKYPEIDNYIDVARCVSSLVRQEGSFGILVCGTGAGMTICANKHKGIYAVYCNGEQCARDAKIINNTNVLCLGATTEAAINSCIAVEFVKTNYEGRKPERLEAIRKLEQENFN